MNNVLMIMNARNLSAFKECVNKLNISKVWFKGYREFELNDEINALTTIEQVTSDVALIFDYPSQWAWEIQPQALNFDYFHEVFDTYSCLKKLGINVDICSSDDKKLNDYKIVFAPSLFLTISGIAGIINPCTN